MSGRAWFLRSSSLLFLIAAAVAARGQAPDLILHHGKIATVDKAFSIADAIAIRGERIVKVGKNDEVLATKGDATKLNRGPPQPLGGQDLAR